MLKIDINSDMGEGFGLYQLGQDEEMMKYISSVNIACGFHAGDPHIMNKTIRLAKEFNVSIGAHPGFPDLIGFGRRYMRASLNEVRDYIIYQLGALREFARYHDAIIQHVKPHGALYMMAMDDENIARTILEAMAKVDPNTIVYALNNSAVVEVGKVMGIRVAKEVYADREHTSNGSIVLTRTGENIVDLKQKAERVVRMVKEGLVKTVTGEEISIEAQTVCIHGDTPGAVELVKEIHIALERNNITVQSIKE
ncbi:LamB/YcsF family protein [Tepidibacillus marianensis]|uniref:LamB/YcsF family protein n=1 Tax=Tepidibacillus marianensis TaxID=3131995 RepID=UPI00386D963B